MAIFSAKIFLIDSNLFAKIKFNISNFQLSPSVFADRCESVLKDVEHG